MHITAPRRHSARTLTLLLFYYAAVGAVGMVAAIVAGVALALSGVEVTPENFAVAFVVVTPVGFVAAMTLWHRYVRPRIKFDREQAFAEFETLKRRYGAD